MDDAGTSNANSNQDLQEHAHQAAADRTDDLNSRHVHPESTRLPPNTDPQALISGLHRRDLRLLQLLAEGLSDRAIAEQLELQPQTVRKYLMQLLAKLGVESRLQAVIFALRHGIVTLD